MLSKITAGTSHKIDLIFLDTLYHFNETLDLVRHVKTRYPDVKLHVYKPDGAENAADFERMHGERLWETNDSLYDYLAKVEPAHRAYAELEVKAVLTGRRRSQGGQRGDLDIVEVDEAGLVKVNPLANWTFAQVKEYITKHNVPYNSLLNKGYKSIGDWHSTRYVFCKSRFGNQSIGPELTRIVTVLLKRAKTSEPADGKTRKKPNAAFTTADPSIPNF